MYAIEADRRSFARVERALRDEADGRELRRDLADNLHSALEPAVGAVRAAVMSMATGGLPHAGEPLRVAVAAGVQVEVQLSGRAAGARIVATKHGMPRGFAQAPKRLNARRGWRHKVYGRDVWVRQVGAPGWFDDTLRRGQERYRTAVRVALDRVARRIATKG